MQQSGLSGDWGCQHHLVNVGVGDQVVSGVWLEMGNSRGKGYMGKGHITHTSSDKQASLFNRDQFKRQ